MTVLWGLAAGCVNVPVQVGPDPFTAGRIAAGFHRLIDEGCYLCLRDAVRQYAALDPGMKESPAIQDAAAQAALLFVMRTKELSVPVDDDWRSARALLDGRAAESSDYALYARIADAMPWNAIGVGEDFVDAERGGRPWPSQQLQDEWRLELAARWPTDENAAYMFLAVDCEFRPQTRVDLTPVRDRYASVPLITYRWASCEPAGQTTLEAISARHPRFYEAQYALASDELRARKFDEAEANDLAAWQGIPRFTEAGVSAADLSMTEEQFDNAVQLYDAVLAVVSTHRRALLGKITALSYLGRHEDAIAESHRLIDMGTWLLGDGYYWLGWNEYEIDRLPQALDDAQKALTYDSSARVHFLNGLVFLKQRALPEAKQEFQKTIDGDADACDAMLDLGQVNAMLAVWGEGAVSFANATGCYVKAEQALALEIVRLRQQGDARALRVAGHRATELNDTKDKHAAALYGAAVSYANTGDRTRAVTFATEAAGFSGYADRARALIARLQGGS
ncbi:MAG: tetratricopeptide repeat protein [Vicinamibacterales bacterium]